MISRLSRRLRATFHIDDQQRIGVLGRFLFLDPDMQYAGAGIQTKSACGTMILRRSATRT
ncbi:MAG: hypothetical protein H0W04_03695 [Chthoniobacterales bacterium]|nr:hypothetical protein [Chthoniobacterales bacterium]